VTLPKGSERFIIVRDTRKLQGKIKIWCFTWKKNDPVPELPLHAGTATQACWTATDGG
jgi:hypothetical protein